MDAETFGSTLGNAAWLMTMDKQYRERPIREIEALIATPILLRQFKLYSKDNQPVGFLTWASVSDAVKEKVETGAPLELADWRSGDNLVVVDVVSPFNPPDVLRDRFMQGAKEVMTAQ